MIMFFVKILAKEKFSSSLKRKENLDFLITTTVIILLTIMGIFMSHYNQNKFMSGIKEIQPKVISTAPSNMAVNLGFTNKVETIFKVNTNTSIFIFATSKKLNK